MPSFACSNAFMSAPGNATGTSKRRQLSPGNHGEVDGSDFSRALEVFAMEVFALEVFALEV